MRTTVAELRGRGPHLSVGVHAARWLALGADLERLATAGVTMIHLDVMDGVWCPQITFGPAVVAAIGDSFVKDVHLMVEDPLAKLGAFVDAGASMITFHLEGLARPRRPLLALAETGVLRGVAIAPGTPVQAVASLLDDLDAVLLVTIEPGWSGQRPDPRTAERLAALRDLIGDRPVLIGLDGGVGRDNLGEMAAFGADIVVSGTAVFAGGDPGATAAEMLATLQAASTHPSEVAS